MSLFSSFTHLTLTSLFLVLSVHAFSIHREKIDSLKNELNQELSDSLRFKVYSDIYKVFYKEDLDSAEHYIQEAITIGKQTNSSLLEIKGLHYLSLIQAKKGNEEEALKTLYIALGKSNTVDQDNLRRLSFIYLGRRYVKMRQYDSSAYYYKKNWEVSEKMGLAPDKLVKAYSDAIYPLLRLNKSESAFELLVKADKHIECNPELISYENQIKILEKFRSFYARVDISRGVQYSQRAFDLRKKNGDIRMAGSEAYVLGVFYHALKKYEPAVKHLEYAAEHYVKGANTEVGYLMNSKLGYSLLHLDQKEKALDAFDRKLQIATSLNNSKYIADAHCSLGELYLSMDKADKAKETLAQAVSLYQKSTEDPKNKIDDKQMLMIYVSMAKADSVLGNFKSSISNYSKVLLLQRDINDLERERAIKELQISYETDKKNDQIKLLNERNAFFSLSAQKQTQLKWMFAIICLLLAAVVGILFNRYRLKQKSMKVIEQKSRENATLVQEMHHRVKNNLQIMLSLLGTQSNLINDSEARKLILESQNRIKSMALIHKNLYQSGSLVMVKADHYFDEIARNILSSFDNNEHNVALKTDIANQEISMAVAVPLGLILNELLTNSIKYAFNGTKDAELVVSFTKAEKDSSYCLRVEDNGKGLPEDFNIATSNSFGLKLVEGLIHQLNGSLEIVRNVGTCFDIYFKDLSRV